MRRTFVILFVVAIVAGATGLIQPVWAQQAISPKASPSVQQPVPHTSIRARPVAAAPVPALTGDQLAAIARQSSVPEGLTDAEEKMLRRVSERLRHRDRAVTLEEWKKLISSVAHRDAATDIDPLVQYALRHAYMESDPELKRHADRTRDAHEETARLRARAEKLRESESSEARTVDRRLQGAGTQTADSVAKDLQKIVVLANSAEEDEKVAQLDLQNALQKKQRTSQAMSNMHKSLHDTAKAIINNIR